MLRGFVLAVFLGFLSCISAAADVGRIENSAGAAVVLRETKVLPATPGTILQLNDIVRTEPGSLLRLVLSDGSALMVGENTELRVAIFDTEKQQTLVEMLHGQVRAEVAKYTKPTGRFVVKTPTASVLALGTVLQVETASASTGSTVTTKELENLPGPNGVPLSLLQTALTVGNKIKPTRSGNSSNRPSQPTSLLDITPGTFTASNLGLYPSVSGTRVTALDHYVVTNGLNSNGSDMTFLLPGQSTDIKRDYGADLGGPIVKDRLWIWGNYGKKDVNLNPVDSSQVPSQTMLRDFDVNGRLCQPAVIMNGEPMTGGAVPTYQYKITGMGTSTGNALQISITNQGPCPLYFFVPAGTIMHPKGFTGRIVGEMLLGGVPNLKDFQKMTTFGLLIRVVPAKAVGAGPVAPTGGEATELMRSYCVELHKLAPHPKTEYKFGDEGDQEKLGGNRVVLERTLRLWQTHQLATDKGQSLDSIIQWSLWARIEKMGPKEFMDAYMKLVHKNYEAKKEKWNKDTEKIVEASGQDLWKMVQLVLK